MTYVPDLNDVDDQACEEKVEELIPTRNKEAILKEISRLVDTEFDRLESNASYFLTTVAADRAERYLERILKGDEDALKALLGVRGSRYRELGYDAGKPWASLIHGRIFETSAMELRRQIVEAHAGLIRNERIADLESIIDGLTHQCQRHESEIDQLRARLR